MAELGVRPFLSVSACAPITGPARSASNARSAPSTMSASPIDANEIYASRANRAAGKTTLIKTIAHAISRRGSAGRLGGVRLLRKAQSTSTASASRAGGDPLKRLSYIMQGSMNVLNPGGEVRHASSTSPSVTSASRCPGS